MSIRMDYVWHDDDAILFRASCDSCSFQSRPSHDEQMARAEWFGHVCVRPGRVRGTPIRTAAGTRPMVDQS